MILNYTNFNRILTNVVVIDTEKDRTTDYSRVITTDPNRFMRLPFRPSDLMEELLLPKDDTMVLKTNDGVVFDCDYKSVPFTATSTR